MSRYCRHFSNSPTGTAAQSPDASSKPGALSGGARPWFVPIHTDGVVPAICRLLLLLSSDCDWMNETAMLRNGNHAWRRFAKRKTACRRGGP